MLASNNMNFFFAKCDHEHEQPVRNMCDWGKSVTKDGKQDSSKDSTKKMPKRKSIPDSLEKMYETMNMMSSLTNYRLWKVKSWDLLLVMKNKPHQRIMRVRSVILTARGD